MSAYDPFIDDSAHVSVGRIQMRIGYLAHCLGIPAATLSALRSGEMVAVPREHLNDIDAFMKHGVISDVGSAAYSRARVAHRARMLTAAKDARHD